MPLRLNCSAAVRGDSVVINLDGESLTVTQVREVAVGKLKVQINQATKEKLKRTRQVVEKAIQSGEKIYSINTGFGVLSKVRIEPHQLDELQVNIIRSHCAGVGEPHSESEARAILLLRANCLAKGHSGVRPEVVELQCEMLNHGVTPVIPSKGSVGASGDLAPLAHLASVLIGEGEAFYQGVRMRGGEALRKAGLIPLRLGPKEGLSLINGTQQMTGWGALLVMSAEELCHISDLICTTSLDGVQGTPRAFAKWLHDTRPFAGQQESAARMLAFSQGSEIYQNHKSCDRVQDPYSFRCAPQVHGASLDLIHFAKKQIGVELNAATDNPLINLETGEITSNGNFHGQPMAFALDIMAMGICELGSISERRTVKLLNPFFSELPTFLVKAEGLNSGLMMAQVTAASLVSENRLLSHPGSTESMSTNNDKEDHVSMGPLCARKAKMILENAQYILAIEAISACQALEFRKPLKPGKGPQFLYDFVRKQIAPLDNDRYLHTDIEWMKKMIQDGTLYQAMREARLI